MWVEVLGLVCVFQTILYINVLKCLSATFTSLSPGSVLRRALLLSRLCSALWRDDTLFSKWLNQLLLPPAASKFFLSHLLVLSNLAVFHLVCQLLAIFWVWHDILLWLVCTSLTLNHTACLLPSLWVSSLCFSVLWEMMVYGHNCLLSCLGSQDLGKHAGYSSFCVVCEHLYLVLQGSSPQFMIFIAIAHFTTVRCIDLLLLLMCFCVIWEVLPSHVFLHYILNFESLGPS